MKKIIFAIVLGLSFGASIADAGLTVVKRKYGVQCTIPIVIWDSNSPWALYETAPIAADTFIVKNTKAPAATANAATDRGKTHDIVLTATEMAAKDIQVIVQDQTSPAVFGDEVVIVHTFGDANSNEPFDTSTATPTVNISTISAGAITAAAVASNALTNDELATSFIDEILDNTLTNNNTKNSLAWNVKKSSGGSTEGIDSGTCTGGSTNTIILAASAIAEANRYNRCTVYISGGTGQGQTNYIVSYSAARVATCLYDWATQPVSGNSTYIVYATTDSQSGYIGTAQAGGVATVTLGTDASSTNDAYDNALVKIVSGTGAGQIRTALATGSYVGATNVLTVTAAWDIPPDNTSVVAVILSPALALADTGSPTPGLTMADVQSAMADVGYDSTLAANLGTTNTSVGTMLTRLGTPAGASVSADIAAVKGDTVSILTNMVQNVFDYVLTGLGMTFEELCELLPPSY